MESTLYNAYVDILKQELVPAMGCTEPIAVAYAAALAAKALPEKATEVRITVSSNIIKNVKSVIVPNTGGLHGLEAAAAAGIVAGDPDKKLLVISAINDEQKQQIRQYLDEAQFTVVESYSGEILDILIHLKSPKHSSLCRIAGSHTNVVSMESDGTVTLSKKVELATEDSHSALEVLTIKDIVEFADTVNIDDVKPTLKRQIDCNMAIAKEGLENNYGARIGQVLLKTRGDDPVTKARAYAAAASDARMGGCSLPVVINSGSGNQGLTLSLPVNEYAREMKLSREALYRALIVSNLISIHIKRHIGSLSAFCGAVSAACTAGAALTYMCGGSYEQVSATIINTLGNTAGIVCDGAKASCAAKISCALEAAIVAHHMSMRGNAFEANTGIIRESLEETIQSIGHVGRVGMKETDIEILNIMLDNVSFKH